MSAVLPPGWGRFHSGDTKPSSPATSKHISPLPAHECRSWESRAPFSCLSPAPPVPPLHALHVPSAPHRSIQPCFAFPATMPTSRNKYHQPSSKIFFRAEMGALQRCIIETSQLTGVYCLGRAVQPGLFYSDVLPGPGNRYLYSPGVLTRLGAWILMDRAPERQAGRSLFPLLPRSGASPSIPPCHRDAATVPPGPGQGAAASPCPPLLLLAGEKRPKGSLSLPAARCRCQRR